MPVKPKPFVLECTQCHWEKVFAPRSDCFIGGVDFVQQCPVCGNQSLKCRKPNAIELITVQANMKLRELKHFFN